MTEATTKKKAAPRKKAAKKSSAKTTELAETKHQEVAAQAQMSPIAQMQQLKAMGMSVEDMKGMLALQKEYEANEALKQFNISLAAFKAENIVITKDKTVGYENTDGSLTGYTHASLANIIRTATPYLSNHGFSIRWKTEQGGEDSKGGVKVTCIMTHQAGHSEQTSLFSSPDNTGGKNSIQAIASAVTYLERYTFTAITGLAAEDRAAEDDGAGAAPEIEVELLPEYPQASFNDKLSQWVDLIVSGTKTVDGIINTVESRFTMTEDQKNELRSYKPQ